MKTVERHRRSASCKPLRRRRYLSSLEEVQVHYKRSGNVCACVLKMAAAVVCGEGLDFAQHAATTRCFLSRLSLGLGLEALGNRVDPCGSVESQPCTHRRADGSWVPKELLKMLKNAQSSKLKARLCGDVFTNVEFSRTRQLASHNFAHGFDTVTVSHSLAMPLDEK